jgi:hypothetical protein
MVKIPLQISFAESKHMTNLTTQLISIDGISGMYYQQSSHPTTIVIYGLGAPVVPDSGTLFEAQSILKYQTDLLVPDYIGYGRSDGTCTPDNCIQTFLQLDEQLTQGCRGRNFYLNTEVQLKYSTIIYIGRSFGGTYVPLLPRYNPSITQLGIIFPAVDNASCGSIEGEESNEDFMRAMLEGGYKYLYRGIDQPVWQDHLQNADGLSPMDNIEHLAATRLFIAHGKQDACINYTKSEKYYQKILATLPDQADQFKLKIYENGGHNSQTASEACEDILNWFQIPKLPQQ